MDELKEIRTEILELGLLELRKALSDQLSLAEARAELIAFQQRASCERILVSGSLKALADEMDYWRVILFDRADRLPDKEEETPEAKRKEMRMVPGRRNGKTVEAAPDVGAFRRWFNRFLGKEDRDFRLMLKIREVELRGQVDESGRLLYTLDDIAEMQRISKWSVRRIAKTQTYSSGLTDLLGTIREGN